MTWSISRAALSHIRVAVLRWPCATAACCLIITSCRKRVEYANWLNVNTNRSLFTHHRAPKITLTKNYQFLHAQRTILVRFGPVSPLTPWPVDDPGLEETGKRKREKRVSRGERRTARKERRGCEDFAKCVCLCKCVRKTDKEKGARKKEKGERVLVGRRGTTTGFTLV